MKKRTKTALAILALCFLTGAFAETDAPFTRAYPVAEVRAIRVDNEDARAVRFLTEDGAVFCAAYVIENDTAHLCLDIAPEDDPAALQFSAPGQEAVLSDLLDAQRGAFVCDLPLPDAEQRFVYVSILDSPPEEDAQTVGVYLVFGEGSIADLEADLRAQGLASAWEYAENQPEPVAEQYTLYVMDQYGAPVPGVMVNFCTDVACVMQKSDENGVVSFAGVPGVYHVQLLKVPAGYTFDPAFELYTGDAYAAWALRVWKE